MEPTQRRAVRVLVAGACVAASLAASGCRRDRPGSGGGATASVVFTVDAEDLRGAGPSLRVVFGPRGAGVAWVVRRADGIHVLHDGKAGRPVGAVDQIAISPDGKRIAYGAQVDGPWRMIVDGAPGVMSSSATDPVFSPDSRHVGYVVGVEEAKRVVVDGLQGPSCRDVIGAPAFSADSTLVAYAEIAEEGQAPRLVVSDLSFAKPEVKATGVKQVVASETGTAIAAAVEDGDGEHVVVLELARGRSARAGPSYDAVSSLAFGPDGATVAYIAEKEGRRLLVLGGAESPLPEGSVPDARRYDEVADLAYAGDGRSTAFCARKGESWFVVANGREGPAFDRVVSPVFAPDGGRLVYRARKDGRRFVVIADAKGSTLRQLPAYEQVFPVIFTPDGKSITYGVKDGSRLAWNVEPL